jgi:hypothetical protein
LSPRNTSTGGVLESMILPSLRRGGYHFRRGVRVGLRFGGDRPHLIDALAWEASGHTYLISLKWQQTSGTAEQKVPYEVMCLAEAVLGNTREFGVTTCSDCGEPYSGDSELPLRPYLVLGGEGWTLRQFYIGDGLNQHMQYRNLVAVQTLESFVARANKGAL